MAISKSQLLKAKIITKMAYLEVLKEEIEEMRIKQGKLLDKELEKKYPNIKEFKNEKNRKVKG
jgi:hypothetical protein